MYDIRTSDIDARKINGTNQITNDRDQAFAKHVRRQTLTHTSRYPTQPLNPLRDYCQRRPLNVVISFLKIS